MRKLALAAALSAAFAPAALAQVADGTYQFISGPGVGNPPFAVTGGIPAPGGSAMGAHPPNCAGIHVHGVFNGFADPNPGGCGHGIISLLVAPPAVSGGGLPGGAPTNVAGQLALTSAAAPTRSFPVSLAGDAFNLAFVGAFGPPLAGSTDANDGNIALALWWSRWSGDAGDERITDFETGIAAGGRLLFLTTEERRKENATKPAPVAPGSKPAATAPGAAVKVNPTSVEAPRTPLATALQNPSQQVLIAPSTTSWLEEFAAYDDQAADGYRRDADKTKQQAEEWRKLADDARRDAERNRQRAEDARRGGRENEARDWEKEAERDEARAGERDENAERLDKWSDEAERREQAARDQAQERRDAAERAREQARQAERDRAARLRAEAEEKARVAREAREARQAQERAEREARIRELEDRVRAREAERARARAAAEREHRAWLDQQQRERDARARGGWTDADANAAAARKKKKEEEEGKTWADYVVEYADSAANWVKDKIKGKVEDKVKETLMERSGVGAALDNTGLDKSLGAVTDGIGKIQAVKKLGDSMEAELRRQPGLRDRIENRMEQWSSARPHMEYSQKSNRDMQRGESGNLYGKEMFGTVSRMVEANK